MTTVAFTGPSKPPSSALLRVRDTLKNLEADVYVTGGAEGIDTYALYYAYYYHPDAQHVICVPEGEYYNKPSVDWATRSGEFEIVQVPGGYMKRNDEMIRRADKLVAFPPTTQQPTNKRGGPAPGTWATIRRAWAKGIPVEMYPIEKALVNQ